MQLTLFSVKINIKIEINLIMYLTVRVKFKFIIFINSFSLPPNEKLPSARAASSFDEAIAAVF
jgi:hypothetical protein